MKPLSNDDNVPGNMKGKFIGDFAAVGENISGWESMAYKKMFHGKTRDKNLVRRSLSQTCPKVHVSTNLLNGMFNLRSE